MFYLFSSNAEPRYLRGILEALCYPERHILRFRYESKYVSDEIRKNVSAAKNHQQFSKDNSIGILSYAEIQADGFSLFPTRFVEIVRIRRQGSIFYVDTRLGPFFDHSKESALEEFRRRIVSFDSHPLPQLKNGTGPTWIDGERKLYESLDSSQQKRSYQGYFLLSNRKHDVELLKKRSSDFAAWESVSHCLVQKAPPMKNCVFYHVMGFFKVCRPLPWRDSVEQLLPSTDDGWGTTYPLPMGERVVLKILSFTPENSAVPLSQRFQLHLDPNAFAGSEEREILFTSRYNEERIELACARVFDSLLAPVFFEHIPETNDSDLEPTGASAGKPKDLPKEGKRGTTEIISPRSALFAQIRVPRTTFVIILAGLVITPLLLSLTPDFLRDFGSEPTLMHKAPWVAGILVTRAARVVEFSKATAAAVTLIVGYLGLRRLPIGK